ncbi:fructose-6-phosphate aldolase [Anaplasmataceae bacterium AB001_6]|nr:fructose-6-phosphate aldolase [Anaplasmataceae bacterium AB001_6]
MQIFLDTADAIEIEKCGKSGIIDGVTTNPTLIAQSGGNYIDSLRNICSIISGPVSAEVVSETYEDMLNEAYKLRSIADNIVIKLPLIADSFQVARALTKDNIPVNFTLCFSLPQAILVAKLGAAFVSPFVGRIEDISYSGINLIEDIVNVYDNYSFTTKIIVASVRNIGHIIDAARIGADIVTIPPQLFKSLFDHPLTEKGLEIFRMANQNI